MTSTPIGLHLGRSHWRTDRRLRVAVAVTTLFHGGLLATGSHQRTYDAYVHLFFADHYARDWFSSWEPRWYTGFPVVSYPPGVHQMLALLRAPFGTDLAYFIVQLSGLLLLVLGVYRFAGLWVGSRAAGWAALAVSVSSSLALVVHVFGQLPTTLALAFLLNAQPSIARWLSLGHRRDLVLALAFVASTTAVHHVTTLFGSVFFTGPVIARVLLDAFARPTTGEPIGRIVSPRPNLLVPMVARRLRRMLPTIRRTAVLGVAIVITLAVVILPYWLWSSRDPIVQVPIPHGSRENFLTQTDAGLVFWLVPWASLLLVLPFALGRSVLTKRWPLVASTSLLLLLGTGGTTPIPKLLLGGAFDILTLDRFTIWATITVLPLVAVVAEGLAGEGQTTGGSPSLRAAFGRRAPGLLLAFCAVVAVGSSVFAASLASFRPMQPDAVDPDPITSFLAKDDHDDWRYLMLGFGDQMAAISAETTALTVDGNYHSARRLPELTSRSVERLEGAKFRGVPGLGSLQQFLANPERYNLKFVFSNDAFYEPLLWSLGWNRLGPLDNNVVVWERADVSPLPAQGPRPEIPLWQRLMWGVLPPSAVAAAGAATVALAVGRSGPAAEKPRRNGRFDRMLERSAARLGEVKRRESRTVLFTLPSFERIATPRRLRSAAVVLATGLTIAGATLAWTLSASQSGPGETVVDYYERLDIQDYEQAWDLLDPEMRLPLGEHLEVRSLRDGLVDGYAELDSIRVRSVAVAGDTATVVVDLEYLTSIETLDVTHTHTLAERDGQWRILPDPEPVTPAGALGATGHADRDVRYSTSASRTADGELVETPLRPLVETTQPRIAVVDGTWTVLGELVNVDRVPAQITVTADLLDDRGELVASASASTHTVHTVLPAETVPYRIDFSADSVGDFDPDTEGGPLTGTEPLADSVVSARVSVRSVATTHRTERDLDVVALVGGTDLISMDLRNTSAAAVTIPKVVVSYFDDQGRLSWVDTTFVRRSVAPQDRISVTSPVDVPDRTEVPDVAVEVVGAAATVDRLRPDRFVMGNSSVAFDLGGFERGSEA